MFWFCRSFENWCSCLSYDNDRQMAKWPIYHRQQWQRTVIVQILIVGHLLYRNSTSPFLQNSRLFSSYQLKILFFILQLIWKLVQLFLLLKWQGNGLVTYHHQQWQRTVVLQIPIVEHLLHRNSTSPFYNIQNHSFFQLKIELNKGDF